MKKTLSNNEAFGASRILSTIKSKDFRFNMVVLANIRTLEIHMGDVQKAMEGLSEEERKKVGLERVVLEFKTVKLDDLPNELEPVPEEVAKELSKVFTSVKDASGVGDVQNMTILNYMLED